MIQAGEACFNEGGLAPRSHGLHVLRRQQAAEPTRIQPQQVFGRESDVALRLLAGADVVLHNATESVLRPRRGFQTCDI